MFHIGQHVVIKSDRQQKTYSINGIAYDMYDKRVYSVMDWESGEPVCDTFYDDDLREPTK